MSMRKFPKKLSSCILLTFFSRKINIWAGLIILSPYLGPLLAAFIITTQAWNWAFAVCAIMTALCLIAIVLLVDETYYDRRIPMASQPPCDSKLMRLTGVSQWRSRALRNSFAGAMLRPWILLSKVPVALASFHYMITFAWVVGINTTFSIFQGPLYSFGPKQIGMSPHYKISFILEVYEVWFSINIGLNRFLLLYPDSRCFDW